MDERLKYTEERHVKIKCRLCEGISYRNTKHIVVVAVQSLGCVPLFATL